MTDPAQIARLAEGRAAEAVNALDWDAVYRDARRRVLRDATGTFYDQHLAHEIADRLAAHLTAAQEKKDG